MVGLTTAAGSALCRALAFTAVDVETRNHREGCERMKGNGEQTYFQKGLGLRKEIKPELEAIYNSSLVDLIKANGHQLTVGDLTLYLAREFGFCYGVDRAVEYAYEARRKFPDRRIWLIGEIIHNPHVNERMLEMGISFLSGQYASDEGYEAVKRDDVVILPAFGVPLEDMEILRRIGCVMVDTTCGSVIVVWKNVERYARDGFTSLIHGKYYHEETMATASRANENNGRYIIVRDMAEAELVCDYIRGRGMEKGAFIERFSAAVSEGFDPEEDLQRIGLANQTTMLMNESLEIAGAVRDGGALGRGRDRAALPELRHDLQCDPGSTGCDPLAAGKAPRSDGGHRRL